MTNFSTHESFYHGLIKSKLWLCQELEKAIDIESLKKPELHVLGCWDNLLTFMLLTRNPDLYSVAHGYDIDINAIDDANRICDMWRFENPKVYNHVQDVNDYDFSANNESIFINCSIDQMSNNKWYDTIPNNSLVCIQTTDKTDPEFPWYIKQTTSNLDELISRFNLNKLIYSGVTDITYNIGGYKRFMIIGTK